MTFFLDSFPNNEKILMNVILFLEGSVCLYVTILGIIKYIKQPPPLPFLPLLFLVDVNLNVSRSKSILLRKAINKEGANINGI